MSELKPCPCCGGEAFLEEDSRGFRVVCNSGSSCDIAQQNSNWTKKAAIDIWNNRPSPWVSVSMKQIKSIAEFAGFAVNTFDYSDNEMNETEFVISESEKVDNEDGTYYEGMTVHCAEYPEEGFMALEDKPSLPQPPKEIG